jgi:hypothetical protein
MTRIKEPLPFTKIAYHSVQFCFSTLYLTQNRRLNTASSSNENFSSARLWFFPSTRLLLARYKFCFNVPFFKRHVVKHIYVVT